MSALHELWTDFDSRAYSHGYLILAVSLWLLVRATPALVAAAPSFRPSLLGFAGLLIATPLWVIAWNAGLREGYLLLFPAILWLAVLAAFGFAAAWHVAFAIGYLYFAIPVWSHINGVLQNLTTVMAFGMLRLVGVSAYTQGNVIHIPAGAFEVAGGCSGLHYFEVGLAIATLLGEVDRVPPRRRMFLVALMGVLAIVCNWIRVFCVALAGQLTNMESYLVKVDHYWFGWALFALTMFGVIWFAGRAGAPPPSSPPRRDAVSSSASLRPVMVTALVMTVLPLSQWMVRALSDEPVSIARELPAGSSGWTGPYSAAQGWRPVFQGATWEALAAYRDEDARAIEVYNVAYRDQRQGAELVGYGNSLLGNSGLTLQSQSVVQTRSGRMIETMATDVGGRQSIIWSVYDIDGHLFVEPLRSQLWYGVMALASRPVASLAAARAVCVPDCNGAREKLDRFFEQMGGPLLHRATIKGLRSDSSNAR